MAPSEIRIQQSVGPVTDLRRSEVATRVSTGGHIGPTSISSHSRSHHITSTSSANIPLHARPAYFSKSSMAETGNKEVGGSDSGGPPTRCVVCHSLANFLCSGWHSDEHTPRKGMFVTVPLWMSEDILLHCQMSELSLVQPFYGL